MSQESERQTRKTRIDRKLRTVGWTIIKYFEGLNISPLVCHAVEEYPTASGPADYALFVDGQLLGFLEAKKVTVGSQNVLGAMFICGV